MKDKRTRISLIGSTGSIGTQTLDVVRRYHDRFEIIGLTAHSNISLLRKQIVEFNPQFIGITSNMKKDEIFKMISDVVSADSEIVCGEGALNAASSLASSDLVFLSVVGVCGLTAAYNALKHGKNLALANKEALVVGGSILTDLAKQNNVQIIPVDSEHSAIFQCLNAGKRKDLKRLILTCSGGAFRDLNKYELKDAKAKDALKHPTWQMGSKITIDCATLMNKGLEVIEARHLFDFENIDCVLHKESIIHSMVEFTDNSVIAQMSYPTMEIPIMYAMTFPKRLPSTVPPLDFENLKKLSFEKIDIERFPCIEIAKSVMNDSGACTVLNAANEEAVKLYLSDKILFTDIPDLINRSLDNVKRDKANSVEQLLNIDKATREYIFKVKG